MQNEEAFHLGRRFAPDARPGQHRHRVSAGITHALFGGEHVILIQAQLDFENLPLPVIPGERDRLARRKRPAADLPIRIPIRHLGAAIGGGPTPLREVRRGGITRREKPHGRGARISGFAVAEQHQIIQPRASQIEIARDRGAFDCDALCGRAGDRRRFLLRRCGQHRRRRHGRTGSGGRGHRWRRHLLRDGRRRFGRRHHALVDIKQQQYAD